MAYKSKSGDKNSFYTPRNKLAIIEKNTYLMKKWKKKRMIIISLILIIISLIFPFFMAEESDNLLAILSASLAAVGAVIALIALYIALILFQKFGLESKFIERKTDKVLELVDLLKGKTYIIQTKKFKYFMTFGKEDFEQLNREQYYIYMKDKILTMDIPDYKKGTEKILNISKSYWLPKEIKVKLDFFEIYAFDDEKKIDKKDDKYAKLTFHFGKTNSMKWSATVPQFTIEEFIFKKNELTVEIKKWLSNHCEIELDLKLNQTNQIEKN